MDDLVEIDREPMEKIVVEWLRTRPSNTTLMGGYIDLWHDTDEQYKEFAHWFTKAMFGVIAYANRNEPQSINTVSGNKVNVGSGASSHVLDTHGVDRQASE